MKISMISIGDELLDGRVQDSNSQIVGLALSHFGQGLGRVSVVPDEIAQIVRALDECDKGWIVVSGGLGPTEDDLTRFALAQWSGRNLIEDEKTLEGIKARFEKMNYPFTENNKRQALFPKGSTLLPNNRGSAPGFIVEKDDKKVFVFPGPPKEFEWFFSTYMEEELSKKIEKKAVRKVVFQGIGESKLADHISGLSEFEVNVGYRAFFPNLELKISASNEEILSKAFDYVLDRAGDWYVCEGDESLAGKVGGLLNEAGQKLSTAESCTAGGIAAAITDISGSSSWFEMGFVTYSNQAKTELVGVETDILDSFGAVSAQVVCQMAAGAKAKSNADFALSVSGIAGPGGGSEEKPVGTVWFGMATPRGVFCVKYLFRNYDRERVRSATISTALRLLLWELEGKTEHHSIIQGPFSDLDVYAESGVNLESSP